MKEAKMGILTFHRCINYGSYWQARCLVEGLQARGYDTVLLDHHTRRVNLAEWKCAYQPLLPAIVPSSDQPLYREKIERFFSAFEALPLSPRFSLHHPEQMEHYDTVVIGSDEVWNLVHPWYVSCPLFYGEGVRATRLISYAASFGNYPAAWGLEKVWADKLRAFDIISVRDANSQQLLQQVQIESNIVLDPCLQFPVVPDVREHNFLEAPYLAVYGHSFTPSFATAVRRYATQHHLPLISIGYRNDWADVQWLTADPHDFAVFMQQAEAIATNFFHGCIFALRNNKPFVCESSSYRSNKIQGLMNELNGEKHLMAEDTPAMLYQSCLHEPLHSNITEKMNLLRQRSNAYLDQALDAKHVQAA